MSSPRAEEMLAADISQIAAASFSPDTIKINIVGEVSSPGPVEVAPNTPLSQGVLAAGGFNNRASKGTVDLDSAQRKWHCDPQCAIAVDFAKGIDESANPLLRNNDIIVVRRSSAASFSDTLDSIVGPLGRAFSLFSIPASIFDLFD